MHPSLEGSLCAAAACCQAHQPPVAAGAAAVRQPPRHSPRRSPLSVLPLLLAPALLAPLLLAAPARSAETATVQEILDGRELYIDRRPARVKERAAAPQQLSTGNSRGQLAFGSGAAGRLNRHSLLRLGQDCFLLEKGQVLISGAQAGCTRSARLSVRGTNYLLELQDDGSSEVVVLEGQVEVQPLRDGEATEAPPTTVSAGQRLRISPQGLILALLGLSNEDYTSIITGPLFEGFNLPLPAQAALDSLIRSRLPALPTPAVPGLQSLPRFGFF